MTQKQLEKLSRRRLLELLAQQTGRAERLERENARLKERIADRELHLIQMGTLAETIVRSGAQLGRVQGAQYLQEIQSLTAQPEEEEQEDPDPPGHIDWPTREQLLLEAQREGGKRRYLWSLKTTVYAMITVAAAAVLVAVLLLPVLQIYGTSMNPTLYEGDFVVSVKGGKMETGDLVAFYYNNKILVKRVIGQAGQWIDIAEDGTVYVDNVKIDEPYLTDRGLGECDIELPYQVPENRVFVMGDNRSISVDSRSTTIGCVSEEQLVGRIVFRIWPLSEFGEL
ncbi:MAG: signal peptidase I [Oscillibacter sp.]|nr:signal peptidase I [Oscillibacter sp.]